MRTLPSANVAQTMESPTITASHSVSRRGAMRFRVEISKTGGGGGGEVVAQGLARVFCCFCTQGPWCPGASVEEIWEIASWVHRACAEKHMSRGGGSVSNALYTYPGLVSVSPGCFQHDSPLPQLGLPLHQAPNAARARPHLHSKVDTNPPLKQVTVKQC